jgi:hypothetical protein
MAFLIRDVFRCKPGRASALVEVFRRVGPLFEQAHGFRRPRILVDYVTSYWTVVLEAEVESLAQFDEHMATYASTPAIREAMAGYLENVEGGHREVFRIVDVPAGA